MYYCAVRIFFFFSSRRRHTRCHGDWSSDVCSSDLPWYAGLVSWSGRSVPVVSFEGAFGQTLPVVSSRTRIVIFHASSGKLQSGYFGMLTQGFPQLVRVNADVVRPDPSRSFPERSPVICQVRMVNETPLIPDLQRLEQMIAEETSVMV